MSRSSRLQRADTGTGRNRRRLNPEEIAAGAIPDAFTSAEWRAMARTSHGHHCYAAAEAVADAIDGGPRTIGVHREIITRLILVLRRHFPR
jgi:hypothetical protein